MTEYKYVDLLPEPVPEEGTLFLSPPFGHTTKKIKNLLKKLKLDFIQPEEGVFEIYFNTNSLKAFCRSSMETLICREMKDTFTLLKSKKEKPKILDILRAKSLDGLIARIDSEWLLELLQKKRLFTYFQPILHSKTPTSIFGYECLLRAKDSEGKMISPVRIFNAARMADLLIQVDRAARLAAVSNAAENKITEKLFINFNPLSIYDPYYCLKSTVKALDRLKFKPDSIVFEVVESDHITDVDHLIDILNFYRKSGFLVALDDFGSGYSSFSLLTKLKPDIIKLNMDLVRDIDKDTYKAEIAMRIIEMAKKLNVKTVVEGVETREQLDWTQKYEVDFVQGYLFGMPGCPPPKPLVLD
ncbi:MAG: EAL domain-containing protein [Vulcanimicrobiota bacterium]